MENTHHSAVEINTELSILIWLIGTFPDEHERHMYTFSMIIPNEHERHMCTFPRIFPDQQEHRICTTLQLPLFFKW